ncbi:Glutathione S-transferase [Coniochaeta hoffmannii]|uniref:Glutathione S-transferase n=1 Tax=Coniochaeta hoffmannii TaxID=91930 RepID=A0AA38S8W4_9PEZI|nr:Glutathione S-transferase [Coniochaeta hoffmannii]
MGLVVHHLHMSQSERVPWLCEELGIDYELKLYDRAPVMAPAEYKALHPQGTAPVIQDGDLTLAESGAVLEYIAHRHGDGRLFLPPSHPAYAEFLFWWHWGNASFMPTTIRVMAARTSGGAGAMTKIAEDRFARQVRMLDDRLKTNEWLAGEEFTAADVMIVFPLTTWRYWSGLSWAGYDGILAYLQRVGKREAYRRAMEKADPGMELLLGAEPPKRDRSQDLASNKSG